MRDEAPLLLTERVDAAHSGSVARRESPWVRWAIDLSVFALVVLFLG